MLRDQVGDRRLVMLLPTFKKDQKEAYYRFTPSEVAWLRDSSERHRAVIGLREHMADRGRLYSQILSRCNPSTSPRGDTRTSRCSIAWSTR